jgi:hypothetical protein
MRRHCVGQLQPLNGIYLYGNKPSHLQESQGGFKSRATLSATSSLRTSATSQFCDRYCIDHKILTTWLVDSDAQRSREFLLHPKEPNLVKAPKEAQRILRKPGRRGIPRHTVSQPKRRIFATCAGGVAGTAMWSRCQEGRVRLDEQLFDRPILCAKFGERFECHRPGKCIKFGRHTSARPSGHPRINGISSRWSTHIEQCIEDSTMCIAIVNDERFIDLFCERYMTPKRVGLVSITVVLARFEKKSSPVSPIAHTRGWRANSAIIARSLKSSTTGASLGCSAIRG